MEKMRSFRGIIRAIWQLATYLLIGVSLFLFLLPTAPFMGRSKTILCIWIWVDRLVATTVHFTWKRTISGITGQYMHTESRYRYQAMVIDKLAEIINKEYNHCEIAYRWEQKIGVV